VANTHAYNAWLHFVDNSKKAHYFYIWVMEYDQPFELAGVEEQAKKYQHFYSKSYAPGDMTVTGRSPYQTEYNNLAEYIRAYHNALINSAPASNAKGDFIPLLTLHIPAEGVSVTGVIKSFEAGAKRFNVAPPFTFDFMVIRNAHQITTNFTPSHVIRSTWSGAYVSSAPELKKKKNTKPAPKKKKHGGGLSIPHPGTNP